MFDTANRTYDSKRLGSIDSGLEDKFPQLIGPNEVRSASKQEKVLAADLVQIMLLIPILFISHLNWLGSLGIAELGQVAVTPWCQSFSPAGCEAVSYHPAQSQLCPSDQASAEASLNQAVLQESAAQLPNFARLTTSGRHTVSHNVAATPAH